MYFEQMLSTINGGESRKSIIEMRTWKNVSKDFSLFLHAIRATWLELRYHESITNESIHNIKLYITSHTFLLLFTTVTQYLLSKFLIFRIFTPPTSTNLSVQICICNLNIFKTETTKHIKVLCIVNFDKFCNSKRFLTGVIRLKRKLSDFSPKNNFFYLYEKDFFLLVFKNKRNNL